MAGNGRRGTCGLMARGVLSAERAYGGAAGGAVSTRLVPAMGPAAVVSQFGDIACAGAGAALGGTAADIAMWTGCFTVVAGLVISVAVLPRIGLSLAEIGSAGLPHGLCRWRVQALSRR